MGQAGELSIWEFPGVEMYHMVYYHFILAFISNFYLIFSAIWAKLGN